MEKKKAILHIESYSSRDGMLLLSVSDNGVRAMLKGLVELCEHKYGGYVKMEMSPPLQATYDRKGKPELEDMGLHTADSKGDRERRAGR